MKLEYKDNAPITDKSLNDDNDDNDDYNNTDNIKPHTDNNPVPAALLTQKSQSDTFDQQYSIYPLYGKKIDETDTKLYQIPQVYTTALGVRGKDLDLKCFPDLYLFGMYGQRDENRVVKLREYDFIKSRLTSKHSQYRLNIQHDFYLLFNNNIRQITAGIFHKLNVVNPNYKYTAGELLEKLDKD